MQGEHDRHQSHVEEKELLLIDQKRKIQDLKTACATTKQRLQKKEKECLRVMDPMLLEDMEVCSIEVKHMMPVFMSLVEIDKEEA